MELGVDVVGSVPALVHGRIRSDHVVIGDQVPEAQGSPPPVHRSGRCRRRGRSRSGEGRRRSPSTDSRHGIGSTGSGSGFDRSVLVQLGLAHPGGVHLGVAAPGRHQLVVRADFDDTPEVDHHDAVGPHGRRQPVGDEDGGAVLQQDVEGASRSSSPTAGRDWRWPRRGPAPGDGPGMPGPGRSAAARPTTGSGPARGPRCRGPLGIRSTTSVRPTWSTASWISSSLASGRAKAMLSPMVPAKRNGSWGTTPSWLRSECMVTSRRSCPSMRTRPTVGS